MFGELLLLVFLAVLGAYAPALLLLLGVLWMTTLNSEGIDMQGEVVFMQVYEGHSTASVCTCKTQIETCQRAVDAFRIDPEWLQFVQLKCLGFNPPTRRLLNSYGRCNANFKDCADSSVELGAIVDKINNITKEEACQLSAVDEPLKSRKLPPIEIISVLGVLGVLLSTWLISR